MSQSLLGKRSRENLETRLSDEKGEIIGTLNKLNLHTVASESDWKNVSFDHILTDKDELERVQSMVDIFNQTRKKEPWGFFRYLYVYSYSISVFFADRDGYARFCNFSGRRYPPSGRVSSF